MDCDCKRFKESETKQDVCECGHDYIAHLQVVIGECSKPVDIGVYRWPAHVVIMN